MADLIGQPELSRRLVTCHSHPVFICYFLYVNVNGGGQGLTNTVKVGTCGRVGGSAKSL